MPVSAGEVRLRFYFAKIRQINKKKEGVTNGKFS